MKKAHRLFFAIPFDSAIKNLYDGVCRTLRERYPTVSTVIGNQEIGPSPFYSEIASFKAQNRELTEQFVAQIHQADIVIADLTNNNPNVHVELGIALLENKNIIRLTGRPVTELGFDIRNLEVHQYKDENQLTETITRYLDIFFKIKHLPISKEFAPLYCEEPAPIRLMAQQSGGVNIQSNCPPNFIIRDGAVRTDFDILAARTPDDWFGVYFRAGASPFLGSHLVYVRQNGMIEVAVYPGPRIVETLSTGRSVLGRNMLTIQFENDHLDAQMGPDRLLTDKLSHQVAGRVLMAAYRADVVLHSAEMISRDTIDWE